MVGRAEQHAPVVGIADSEKDAGGTADQAVGRDRRILERLPGDLEHQALLRIHAGGFARRDTEQRCVEAGDVVEEAAGTRRHRGRPVGIGVVARLRVPAVGRNLADSVDTLAEHAPQRGVVVHATRQTAG